MSLKSSWVFVFSFLSSIFWALDVLCACSEFKVLPFTSFTPYNCNVQLWFFTVSLEYFAKKIFPSIVHMNNNSVVVKVSFKVKAVFYLSFSCFVTMRQFLIVLFPFFYIFNKFTVESVTFALLLIHYMNANYERLRSHVLPIAVTAPLLM